MPLSLIEANKFILENHRHHYKVIGHKFSIGLMKDGKLIGVAVCGRPVSRYLDNGKTLEITRLCTDGTKNACSKLYSACARIAREMGYEKIITYILQSESGVSLKASGWTCEAKGVGGESWSGKGRKRQRTDEIVTLFGTIKKYANEKKQRWIKYLNT